MAAADSERFRLRRFVERLVQLGECEVHDKPIDLRPRAPVSRRSAASEISQSASSVKTSSIPS